MLNNVFYNTDPQIAHAPGYISKNTFYWNFLTNKIHKIQKQKKINFLIDVITWNNLKVGFCEKSLIQKEIKFSVLGSKISFWNNLNKFSLICDYCKTSTADIILGMDSHDVIFWGDLNVCVERFLNTHKKILFNGELRFYPDIPIPYFQNCKKFQKQNFNYKFCFLNSGLWIGYRDFCSFFFNECSKIHLWKEFDCKKYPMIYNCDQSVIHGMTKKYIKEIGIDDKCQIFQNLAFIKDEVKLNILY